MPKRASKDGRMSSREKILKYCTVEKERHLKGNVLVYGKRKYRMNLLLDDMTDEQCNRVVKYMRLDAYIGRAKGKATGGRKAVVSLDPKPCECGCECTTRRGSRFLPGHDMKLKSALRKAAAGGDPKAQRELESRGWIRVNT